MSKDIITLADLMRHNPNRFFRLGQVARGLGLLGMTRVKENLSLGWLLERQAAKRPDAVAIKFDDRVINYREFNEQANRVAHLLKANGVTRGKAVAVLIENRPELLFAVAGIVKLGGIAAMCNTRQRGETLLHSLRVTHAGAVLVGAELRDSFEEIRGQAGLLEDRIWFVAEQEGQGTPAGYRNLFAEMELQASDNPAETAEINKKDPCFYIFTSGTTGLPKAAIMSHLRWISAASGLGLAGLKLNETDVFYCALPMYHNNALTVSWASVMGSGAALALARKFSATKFWDDIRRYDATAFVYIGELCRYLLNQPPSDLDRKHKVRAVIGNGLRPDIWDDFKQRFGIEQIYEFYGASECNLAFVNLFNMDRTAGYCPMSYAIVQYDIENDQPVLNKFGYMQKVKRGDVGLLITEVTEKAPFEGYTDASASEKKLLRNVFSKGDTWFNTGDLVRDQGWKHVQFIDRLGDTFRWKGENVATTEVENALNSFAQVAESVVYGIELPGADGRAGMAAITLNCAPGSFERAAFAAHVRGRLPAYAVPIFVRLRPEQEITGTFKYRKVDLKREGFRASEPVFVLLPGREAYEPVDDALISQIESRQLRW